ncbi:hypothetical protein SAMN04488105_11792 [Salipiger thiooxidans]|uniref:Uncharacterized protein n=1 Tax=Salipiger thiooxidans TaxID=282683 RepID=A0A1G7K8W2_9RHOB|nr:hypothetical protein [Salipiger thiooxidans]SDF33299.1 hypothetical protein SAMN04488105_11792 [Salipiger thiooxidans]
MTLATVDTRGPAARRAACAGLARSPVECDGGAEAAVICPMLDGRGDLAATDHAMLVAARQGLRCVDAAELLLREPDA